MALTNDIVAVWTLVLVCPSVLFVLALFLRQAPRRGAVPVRTADRIVRWYAAHPQLALWVLLLLLPTSAFVLGTAAILRTWSNNFELRYYTWRALIEIPEHWQAFAIGGVTIVSAILLMMITSHLFRDSHRGDRSIAQ